MKPGTKLRIVLKAKKHFGVHVAKLLLRAFKLLDALGLI